jgi:hypothetical protein
MAATQKKNIWFWSTTEAGPMPIVTQQMAASQGVIIPGSPVEMNSSGLLELSDTDDVVLYGFLCGVVDKSTAWPLAAALSANDEVRVAVARYGDKFGIFCENNGTDSAVAQASVGTDYGIVVSATAGEVGYTSLDLNETTNVLFTVHDIASNLEPSMYTTSDAPGVAIVRANAGLLQG